MVARAAEKINSRRDPRSTDGFLGAQHIKPGRVVITLPASKYLSARAVFIHSHLGDDGACIVSDEVDGEGG